MPLLSIIITIRATYINHYVNHNHLLLKVWKRYKAIHFAYQLVLTHKIMNKLYEWDALFILQYI